MNLLWLILQDPAHTPAAGAAEHAEPVVFGLAANVMTWTLIIFVILLVVLMKFAFPPILGYAAAREKRIQDALDESKRQREEAEKLLEQQRQELAKARGEAQQLIAEGRQAAEKVRQELLTRAKGEQEELIARAKADIEAERLKAVESVRREAVDLALAAAGKLVGEKLNAENDRRIVNDFLSKVRAQDKAAGARS
jgi:F-type H+-transporting ATPase subunit b